MKMCAWGMGGIERMLARLDPSLVFFSRLLFKLMNESRSSLGLLKCARRGTRGGRAPWSPPRWGWRRRQGAGRSPGRRRRAVLALGQWRPRGLAGSGRTRGGASPSPCAGRRSRSSGPRCSHCTSRWPCARSSSSSGCEGETVRGDAGRAPQVPRSPARGGKGKHTLQTNPQSQPWHRVRTEKRQSPRAPG